ncbi:hypothetical protein NX02_01205 [Sphingomonas sanxanigenens DSM 19645 = NX02]|uniref:Uncharacterized protein n=1 Tax=Sphingomonas sanxanigenens DSM 19645 = NX02 TaxID=1123269 RepID=W0A6C2_9SPHN|nr:hypothetical protein NX02_01205 [Sphingomonas sanxanigenens DSM 19645 = NX02]
MCAAFGHRADRGRAAHDGRDYWSKCRWCGKPLIRSMTGWRAGGETESDAHRQLMDDRDRHRTDAGLD